MASASVSAVARSPSAWASDTLFRRGVRREEAVRPGSLRVAAGYSAARWLVSAPPRAASRAARRSARRSAAVCAWASAIEPTASRAAIAVTRRVRLVGLADMFDLGVVRSAAPRRRSALGKVPKLPESMPMARPHHRTMAERSAAGGAAAGAAGLLPGRHQAGRARLQLADAGGRIGMGRQPLRRAASAAGGDHVLPQVDRLARVEAGFGHQPLADHVGLGLLR